MDCETCGKQKLTADMAVASGWLRDHGHEFCRCVSFVSISTTQCGSTGCTQDAYDRIGTIVTTDEGSAETGGEKAAPLSSGHRQVSSGRVTPLNQYSELVP